MIALDIIGQKVSAVALGPLAVLSVIVGVAPIHQHQPVVYNSTVQVPAKSKMGVQVPKSLGTRRPNGLRLSEFTLISEFLSI